MLGVLIMQLNSGDGAYTSDAERLYDQLASLPDAIRVEIIPGEVADAVWGHLMISPDGTQAVLCLWDLPSVTEDQTFQMWLIDDSGARTSGGLFQADASQGALYIQVLGRPVTAYQGGRILNQPGEVPMKTAHRPSVLCPIS
jgi:hypothetical protein